MKKFLKIVAPILILVVSFGVVQVLNAAKPPPEKKEDSQRKVSLYVDTDGALAEAGDILRPIDEGVISLADVRGDLFDLIKSDFKMPEGSTLFKSVGTALEDLIAAKLVYDKSAN